ncbi:uncharacterized protein BDV17DRAFT_85965 [Aspergillus undulatus]|uniref:uncharacterized protein n=1 Tax=Aspergillus undulatus TaxID=1810928 RepID=UPI003CCE1A44
MLSMRARALVVLWGDLLLTRFNLASSNFHPVRGKLTLTLTERNMHDDALMPRLLHTTMIGFHQACSRRLSLPQALLESGLYHGRCNLLIELHAWRAIGEQRASLAPWLGFSGSRSPPWSIRYSYALSCLVGCPTISPTFRPVQTRVPT